MANLKDVIYLSAEDYNTLYTNGTVTINGTTLTYDANNVYIVPDNTQQQIDDILALIPSSATSSNKLATAGDIPTIPTNVSAFNNDAGYLTSHQDISGKADKVNITSGTAGTSSATSGSTLAVPYVTMNTQGIVTGYGTHTHTVTGFLTSHQSLAAYTPTASLPTMGVIINNTYTNCMGTSVTCSVSQASTTTNSNQTYRLTFNSSKKWTIIPISAGTSNYVQIGYCGNTNSSWTATNNTSSQYAVVNVKYVSSVQQQNINALVIGI